MTAAGAPPAATRDPSHPAAAGAAGRVRPPAGPSS